ncbi:Levodione reductase [Fonsecaea pedrosoi]|nr:Levodione reductase [Fonsecaea pedrosoi]
MDSRNRFQDKVIAITGAGSGIGLATAHYLAKEGAALALADIRDEALQQARDLITAQTPGVKLHTYALDVSKNQDVEDWVGAIITAFGRLDGAANLAGVFSRTMDGISTLSDTNWHSLLDINLSGVFYCLRAQQKVISNGSSIVNASSIAGLYGHPNYPAYCVSKAGVLALTRGRVRTPMMDSAQQSLSGVTFSGNPSALQREAEPEEIAALIGFLLSDESRFITGAEYKIDGGRMA